MRFTIHRIACVFFGILQFGIHSPAAAEMTAPKGEHIQWFPALATPEDDHWKMSFSGLVTENESRPAIAWLSKKLLGFSSEDLGPEEKAIFRERTRRFFADDETWKRMKVEILDKNHDFGRTGLNGHFRKTINLSKGNLHPGQQSLECVVHSNRRAYTNEIPVFAVGAAGISVVSDLDDTVKISEVRDWNALMRNTFLRPYRAVPGMSVVYQDWARNSGAQFHYVSGSPWQLFPTLDEFMRTNGFPAGSWQLRTIRLLGYSATQLLSTPDAHKKKAIEELFDRLPERSFVLVGDSGERDPEIYGDLARKHPKRIRHIFIRDVTEEPITSKRYGKAFENLPEGTCSVFELATELPKTLETR